MKVTGSIFTVFSSSGILDAERDLLEFIGSCYHLKDILKADNVLPLGVDIEQWINDTPALALLGDLANLDKHHVLNKAARSGRKPVYVGHKGTTEGTGWRVVVEFEHAGQLVDAAKVARNAMDAWRSFLTLHGLL